MTLEELQKYPNVLDALRTYYKNKLEESIEQTKDVPDDFKEMLREHGADHIDNTIIGVINLNPRMLFDFFDEHKIIIEIRYSSEFGQFVPEVNGISSYTFSKRKDAEGVAVEDAILMLEQRLTKSVSDK
jgi:hypothetical protein